MMLKTLRQWLKSDMRTLRWVLLALYILIIFGLAVPFLIDSEGIVVWLCLFAGLLGSQALFIFGAGTINLCYPIRKARLWMPILVASVMTTLLTAGFIIALMELVYGSGFPETVELLFWPALGISWLFWGTLFWVFTHGRKRHSVLSRLSSTLFAGSLLELMACLPSHIISSKRSYCLAGLMTMLGIIAGIYVMFFSFGPMLVLLFLRPRHRREKLEGDPLCLHCDYNLRGTLDAGRSKCPECGTAITHLASR